MPIPLDFAADCEEIVTISGTHDRALTGYGVFSDGSVRTPPESVPALAVIDDAFLSKYVPDESVLDTLAAACGQGCFFDFVRPMAALHRALVHGLQERLPQAVPIFLPEAYHALAPNSVCVLSRAVPCNHWARYLEEKSAAYPAGWCLELIPWSRTFLRRGKTAEVRRLPYACCEVEARGGELRYFDTPETLQLRLAIAEKYGCCAAIGLYRELKALA